MGTPTSVTPSTNPRLLSTTTEPLQHVDSIIATRQRRQNAGRKLQQLINAEDPLEYEDEDGQNIFQEVEGDDEFDVNASSDEEEEDASRDGDEDDNDDDDGKTTPARRVRLTRPKKAAASSALVHDYKRRKALAVNEGSDNAESEDDDMFSDSEDSSASGDSDDSAGEKEFQRQRRADARQEAKKKRQASFMPAAVLKAQKRRALFEKQLEENAQDSSAPTTGDDLERQRPVKRQKLRTSADQLLSENRRRSTRRAAVKNAEDVIQRLQESEARRAKMTTPTVKVVHRLTQEERLKEAIITEKKNIESLNVFYQQEEERKKDRRAALLAKRTPMTSFIRYVSKTTYFDPIIPPLIEEIGAETAKQTKKELKRKKDSKGKVGSTIQRKPEASADPTQHESEKSDTHTDPAAPVVSPLDGQLPAPLLQTNITSPQISIQIPVEHVTQSHLDPSSPLSQPQSTVSLTTPVSMESISHTATSTLPVTAVGSAHLVLDPTTTTSILPHGPLSPVESVEPVEIAFPSRDEDPYRRSTSVEQLEADYINFHVAEEPTDIDEDVGSLEKHDEVVLVSEHDEELGLGKHDAIQNGQLTAPVAASADHVNSALSSDGLSVAISTGVPAPLLGASSPAFAMSDMVITGTQEKNDLEHHKQDLHHVSVSTNEASSHIIPTTFPTTDTVLASTSTTTVEGPSPVLDPNSTVGLPLGPINSTASTHDEHLASIDIIKPHFDSTLSEPVIIDAPQGTLFGPATEANTNLSLPKLDESETDVPSSYMTQGPAACRAVTTISLMEFPDTFSYATPEIQKVLFGPQSLAIPVPTERANLKNIGSSSTGSGATTATGRKKRGPYEKTRIREALEKSKGAKEALSSATAKVSGALGKKSDAKQGVIPRLTGAASSLASLSANPLLSRGFGMKVGVGGLGVSGASVGPLGTGVIGSGGNEPGGLSVAAANAAAAAAAAAAANGGLTGGSAAARAKSAAALAALQAAPKCVVTGKPCKFVDPKSGLPYSTMEAFQMIRQVINCEVPWNRDFGIFMGSLGKEARHAKGVPPGFK